MAKSPKGIGGWLIAVLVAFALALLSGLSMTAQRISFVLLRSASTGVYISLALLLPYVVLLSYTIYLTLRKKEDAVTMFISSAVMGSLFVVWFFVLGQAIYAPELFRAAWIFDVAVAALNILVFVILGAYLLKSKRVQNTLTKK